MQQPVTNSQPETNPSLIFPQKFQGKNTLRNRLLITILPTVLIPLVVASTIGNILTERRASNQIINELNSDTSLVTKTFTNFLDESLGVTNLVTIDPKLISTIKTVRKQVQEQKLAQKPIAELEKQFAATKLLTIDDELNTYLEKVVEESLTAEIFVTDRNGFNVAYSNPTSDFVQRDEDWWQIAQKEGVFFEDPEFDESANANVIAFAEAIKDPQTGEFLGVLKAGIPLTKLDNNIDTFLFGDHKFSRGDHKQDYQFQIINVQEEVVFDDLTYKKNQDESQKTEKINIQNFELIGGDPILGIAKILMGVAANSLSLEEAEKLISQKTGFTEISLAQEEIFSQSSITAILKYQNKIHTFSTIPNTQLVSMGVVDYQVIAQEGQNLLIVFATTAIILGLVSTVLIILLAQKLSQPLINLSEKTQQAAAGNLDIQANVEGTIETRTLADNFNYLVSQVKDSLHKQEALTNEQRQEKEQLEMAIYTLLDEVSEATEGDLTVRANLDSMELSTVADLFNAIIDSLQEIAVEAKKSTSQVGNALKQNESAIRLLAEQAIKEAQETRETLTSVEQMSQSIQEVATNASQAEKITDDTYSTVQQSSSDMEKTVDSIVNLRTTVAETAKKMKRLGESSQKISQVVSFIEEIALKTNVLAINASVEAGRAGEQGHGFTIVAEQVGALAAQSAAATKEIANIVAAIQRETQEVSIAMESGTSQVVESTRLVESTRESLGLVLEKSQDINQLMRSISQKTVSQASTSQTVTNLMQQIAELSEQSSESSKEIMQSMIETAQVAQNLESAVAKFKVTSDSE